VRSCTCVAVLDVERVVGADENNPVWVFEYWEISGTISRGRSATTVSLTFTYARPGDVGVAARERNGPMR
jgi:hypothetical protein